MKRDIIQITGKEVRATGENIWMSAAEIAGLFNVTAASVQNAIRSILRTDTLNDYEVCRCVRVNERTSVDVYSLELIIPIAYRFDTCYTDMVPQVVGAEGNGNRKATDDTPALAERYILLINNYKVNLSYSYAKMN